MILLVACGNVLRRDDGAGIVLARRLRRQWGGAARPIIECQQLTPDLAPRLADPQIAAALFADAAVSADPAAPLLRHLTDSADLSALGHYLDPAALLDLAARLYGRRPPAWVVSIPAEDFRFGVGLSGRTRQQLRRAEEEILSLWPPAFSKRHIRF